MAVVELDVSERIATITLNRPAARNALSSEVLQLLPQLMRAADADDAVDVIILTGADPAFCAGLDLKELGSTAGNLGGTGADGEVNADGVRGPFPKLVKPLIGAVNGVAITGGFELPRCRRSTAVGAGEPRGSSRRTDDVHPGPRHRHRGQRPARCAPDPRHLCSHQRRPTRLGHRGTRRAGLERGHLQPRACCRTTSRHPGPRPPAIITRRRGRSEPQCRRATSTNAPPSATAAHAATTSNPSECPVSGSRVTTCAGAAG